MTNYLLMSAAAILTIAAASPASAQFAGGHEPTFGSGSFSKGVNTQALIPVDEAAMINRLHAKAGSAQFRPLEKCVDDLAIDTNDDNGPELLSRRRETLPRNITMLAGGFCPSSKRGQR